ncbi:MAG TPA: PD-(D/E)XK nuclease family protein [Nitrospirota bacterium]
MKRTYGRLFLDLMEKLGSSALVQPDVQTLHQFVEKQYSRLGGPRLIDENSRLLLLEGLVKERLVDGYFFNQSPDLLAPSLSAALARTIEQLSAAGVTPQKLSQTIQGSDFFDRPQAKLLVDVYQRYEAALKNKNLADPAGVRSQLLEQFDHRWLSSYRTILIDGLLHASRVEAAILRKISSCGNCTSLVEAATPDLLRRAGEFHPLALTKDFLSGIGVLPEQGKAVPGNDDLFTAEALFSDEPFSKTIEKAPPPASFSKEIRLLSAVNPREEVSLIARRVKKSLKGGATPDAILVAFPSLDDYGLLVEEIFNDFGIPYNRALGRQLGSSPVATAIVSLLRVLHEDFSGPALLRVFSSPFLKFSGQPSLAPALDRLLRLRRITGGKEKLFAALSHSAPGEEGGDTLSESLTDLFAALAPFSAKEAAPLSSWMERLAGLIAWSGLGARVALIKGSLNVNYQAYKKLSDFLGSLSRAGKLFPEYTYTFNEWVFLLKKTLLHARFQVPPEDEGGVQILGIEESAGHAWDEIYLGGLVEGKFPRRLPQNIFLPEPVLESLGVRTLRDARLVAANHFYRLVLSAQRVTITYPENEGDRPAEPSPFLEELTPLKNAGLVNRGIEQTSGIQYSLRIEDSGSVPELAKAIGRAGAATGLGEILDSAREDMSVIKSALESKTAGPAPAPPPPKLEFWVTELDDYLACPYDYYVTYVLGIEPLQEVTEDMLPVDRGSKVHGILKKFYGEAFGNRPVTRENREEARAVLKKLADAAFHKEADTVRNRREKGFFLTVMAERFLDAEIEFWKQGMRPAYLEQKIGRHRLVLPDGSEAELTAKIDRIDVDENGNFIIVDYKTGTYPEPSMGVDQNIFQLPVYAVMAVNKSFEGGPLLKKPIGLAYYDLKGINKGLARDVVLYNKNIRDDHTKIKTKTSPKSEEEFETILTQSMDKARKAVEGILAGGFPSRPREESACRYCENDTMCRFDKEADMEAGNSRYDGP